MEIGKKQRDPKKSLSRQVVDSIEEMIMERKLGPGDVLPTGNSNFRRIAGQQEQCKRGHQNAGGPGRRRDSPGVVHRHQ